MMVEKLSEIRKLCEDSRCRGKVDGELCRVAESDLVCNAFQFVEFRRYVLDIGVLRELTLYTVAVGVEFHVLEELRRLFPDWNITVMCSEQPITVKVGGVERKVPVKLKVVLTRLEENKRL